MIDGSSIGILLSYEHNSPNVTQRKVSNMHWTARLAALTLLTILTATIGVTQTPVAAGPFPQEVRTFYTTADGLPSDNVLGLSWWEGSLAAQTDKGHAVFDGSKWTIVAAATDMELPPRQLARQHGDIIDWAETGDDTWVAGTPEGLVIAKGRDAEFVYPADDTYSWAPRPVNAVAAGPDGAIWFGAPQGVGRFVDGTWTLWTGAEGLPYNDFTCASVGVDGQAWFGTKIGAIRYDGTDFRYRQGLRWLPHDQVNDIVTAPDGSAWIATPAGISHIHFVEMTLWEKAQHYEDLIDQFNRRTEFGYVLESRLKEAGNPAAGHTVHDSDNDGLWTAMYGTGACFAYGATGDARAKENARQAWRALQFLGTVTRGGEHEPPHGFVARTVLPTSGHNPNDTYTVERDQRTQESDSLWKVLSPRWPVSKDGKWYWKTDTSSDELAGHYFFYAQFYDLVANDEEKEAVRAQTAALTDHLIAHDFQLVDHDGNPTRWGRYSPTEVNHDRLWFVERGLNSLSMLSYLTTAAHITGDQKYLDVAKMLREEHAYHQNLMYPKYQRGASSGNHSDDEMAFMCYYNLMKYETDPELRDRYAFSWMMYWVIEQPELNPFFNFSFAAMCSDMTYTDPWGTSPMGPSGPWLEESMQTLYRFPLDRHDWAHTNEHRTDVVPLPKWTYEHDRTPSPGRGMRYNGYVVPVDECHFNHWNRDPFFLNTGGNGQGLADGAVYLLPYYMGLYHGYIAKPEGK